MRENPRIVEADFGEAKSVAENGKRIISRVLLTRGRASLGEGEGDV
jgi:hypothetical protein